MERLSSDNGDLRMFVNKVVFHLHYPPQLNKKVVNKINDDIKRYFLERFQKFHLQNWPSQLSFKLL